MVFIWIICASFIVSLMSFVGLLTFGHKLKKSWMTLLVAFAAGTLLGGAFFELLPESVHLSEMLPESELFIPGLFMLLGIILFYIIEKFIHWHHHHDVDCHHHSVTTLSIVGDIIHNFIDGLLIAAAFVADVRVGIATTIAIIFHEIPQEIGDYAILVHSGFSRAKALLWNFVSGLGSVVGAIVGFYFLQSVNFVPQLLGLTAGAFVYIALADIIPELHGGKHGVNRNYVSIAILLGIGVIYGLTLVIPH